MRQRLFAGSNVLVTAVLTLMLVVGLTATAARSDVACTNPSVMPYPNVQSIPEPLLQMLTHGPVYEERFVAQALQIIRDGGRSHMWIDAVDVQAAKDKLIRTQRRIQISELIGMDANLDGQITADEIRKYYRDISPDAPTSMIESKTQELLNAHDLDHDGVISLKEMGVFTPSASLLREPALWNNLDSWLALAPDHEEKLTVEELQLLARRAFRTIDTNGDGRISEEEAATLSKALSKTEHR